MINRLDLQSKFEEILGSRNVYYQPPESLKMSYPAIRYCKKDIDARYANNKIYSKLKCYEVTVIDTKPDSPLIETLLELPYCSYDRNYKADGLEHDVLTIFI